MLGQLIAPRRRLLELERENCELREQLEELRQQNDSMRTGMRRCTTCSYRLNQQGRTDDGEQSAIPTTQIMEKPSCQ